MNQKPTFRLILATMGFLCIVVACIKYEEVPGNVPDLPFNPFDTIDYNPDGTMNIPIDSSTFLGIHTYIISKKCAQPACHDGSFEPDFRTVVSSYNTLVYHPVLKNDINNTYTYRVVPGDTALSWLHERITTDDTVLGRMPLYDTLPAKQIKLIEDWILDGAKDMFGNSSMLPNYQPATFGLLAFKDTITGMRIDTARARIIDPFAMPANEKINMWIGLYDDTDLPFQFSVNEIKFSENPVDFSNAITLNLNTGITPFIGPSPFGGVLPYFHQVTFNSGIFDAGKTYYTRVYVQDTDHNFPTEIPSDASPIYLWAYFSFKVQ